MADEVMSLPEPGTPEYEALIEQLSTRYDALREGLSPELARERVLREIMSKGSLTLVALNDLLQAVGPAGIATGAGYVAKQVKDVVVAKINADAEVKVARINNGLPEDGAVEQTGDWGLHLTGVDFRHGVRPGRGLALSRLDG